MKSFISSLWLCVFLILGCTQNTPDSVLKVLSHKLKIQFEPDSHRLIAVDTIHVNATHLTEFSFLLHENLDLKSVRVGNQELHHTIDRTRITTIDDCSVDPVQVQKVVVTLPPSLDPKYIEIHYQGDLPESTSGESVQNRASIGSSGIFLSSHSFWYPYFPDQRSALRLIAATPRDYRILTKGHLVHYAESIDSAYCVWQQDQSLGDFILCAADYWKNTRPCNDILLATWFLKDAGDLSDSCLKLCAKYISRYESMIGPYPYKQLVVAENILSNSVSLPSLTLYPRQKLHDLNSLSQSLATEICKNWWGRGVRVDTAQGDWSRPLNLYYSDYLDQESVSNKKAREFRYKKMVEYASLAAEADMALSKIVDSPCQGTDSVMNTKGMMVVHQLRTRLGQDRFDQAIQHFYSSHFDSAATWSDLKDSCEQIYDENLDQFFKQWLTRIGAPKITLKNVSIEQKGSDSLVTISVTQKEPIYDLEIPIVIETPNETVQVTMKLDDRQNSLLVRCNQPPCKVTIDPEYHVFRSLAPEEMASIPPANNPLTWTVAEFESGL